MGATGPFLGGKVTSMKLLTPSCAQLQNMWTYTSDGQTMALGPDAACLEVLSGPRQILK